MPKCTMTFNLPEERNEMFIAQRGIDFYCLILEIKSIIKEYHKYGKKLSEAFKEIELAVNEAQTADLE
ncbi:MAG: hypothetical protein WCJ71_07505 [Candidatus Omnitrophota bacterium]